MIIEFVGKFFDNHSLSIINRNLAIRLASIDDIDVVLTCLDGYDPVHKLDKKIVKTLKELQKKESPGVPDIQIRHCYPPVWTWPVNSQTKVIFIQPWEFAKAPFEWQYKFETFADALIVPSTSVAEVFKLGGLNPDNSFVVPNGYDTDIFNTEESDTKLPAKIDKEKFNFIYVGNPQWRKGLDIMLNAWGKTFKRYDKTSLIIKDSPRIYGANNALNETIKIQYKTDCAEIIYIDDDLSDKEMAAIYKASNSVVHPYRAEGFAMHVQEAMACGCLPIVPGLGPTNDFIPEDVGFKLTTRKTPIDINDNKYFATKPGDAMTLMSSHTFANEPDGQSLIDTLKYLYHHHEKDAYFNKLKETTLNSWETVVEEYVKVFKNVAGRKQVNRFRN